MIKSLAANATGLALAVVSTAEATVITETFTGGVGQFTTSVGNDSNGNNFGFSNSAYANGATGEIGGVFARVNGTSPAYVADTTLGGTLAGSSNFVMSGKFSITGNNNANGGIFAGYFNATPPVIGPNTFIGFMIVETYMSDRFQFCPRIAGTYVSALLLTVGIDYTYDLSYNGTTGTLSGTITNMSTSAITPLTITDASAIAASYTAFGIGSGFANYGDSALRATAYFDDLTYTVVPEPTSLVLAGIAPGVLLGRRRRAYR